MSLDEAEKRLQEAIDRRPENGIAAVLKSDLRKVLDALQAKKLS